MVIHAEILATYLRARFGTSERGAGLVEYGLLVTLIALVCAVAVTFLGRTAEGTATAG